MKSLLSGRFFLLAPAAGLLLTSCNCHPPASFSAPPPLPHKVTVVGTATIKVAPDQMLWSFQISANDATLAAAKTRHDASLTAALAYLKSLGDSIKDLQTGGIRFDKQTYFPPNADRSKPFTCSTQVTFTLTDFDKYGAVADKLATLDGAEVQNVSYDYSKRDDTAREALKQALIDAQGKADGLASTAHCSLGAPLDIIEGGGEGPRPMMAGAMFRAAAPSGTPAAVAGQIEINGTVTATYDLLPK